MSDDYTGAAWQQRGQGPTHVVVDNQTTSSSGGGGAVTDGGGSLTVDDGGTTLSVDDGGGSLTVDGTFWPSTQPVSLATNTPDVTDRAGRLLGHVTVDAAPTTAVTVSALPLPTGAAQDTTLTGGTQKTKLVDSGGTNAASVSAAGAVKVDGSATTQPVSLATNTPDVTDRAARLLGHVTVDTMPTTTVTGTVTANTGTLPALTKGTQGATGISVQDLKDAGRIPVVLSVTSVASAAAEAMFTLNIWKNGAVTTATSYTVTAGKTLRIQAVQFGARFTTPSTTVTFANCRFNLRSGNAVASPLIYGDSKLCASNAPTPNSDLAVPDGLEFAAGTILGVSHVDSAATLSLDLLIVGYEY